MTTKISCSIGTTDPSAKIGLEIWLDDLPIFNVAHVTETTPITYEFAEDEADHVLRFVMKNKTHEDTIVDEDGNIVKDVCLTVSNLSFEDIQLEHVFLTKAVYTHDFNGTQNEVKDKFYGSMGCNGEVSLQFTTPVYLWLLENM